MMLAIGQFAGTLIGHVLLPPSVAPQAIYPCDCWWCIECWLFA